jgi:hypothetical protein
MSVLRLSTEGSEGWFKPGDTIAGQATWHLDTDAEAIDLRLFWFTDVDGSRQVEVVESRRIDRPEPNGERSFRFRIPESPYSFSGRLFTLAWAVELVVIPSGEAERLDIVVGPRPIEVSVQSLRES